MKPPLLLLTISALSLTACATILGDPSKKLTAAERQVACEVTRDLNMGSLYRTIEWEEDIERQKQLASLVKAKETYKALPRRLECEDGKRILSWTNREGFGDFLDSFHLSEDGSIAVVLGGYQYLPMIGGGGECYFSLKDSLWEQIGCIETWRS